MKRGFSFTGNRLATAFIILCSVFSPCITQNNSACLDHFTSDPNILQGYLETVSARFNDYSETTATTTQLITVTWDEDTATANPPTTGVFGDYFEVDSSVPRQWIISLKNTLEGLPDYPNVTAMLETQTTFSGFSDFSQCTFIIVVNLKDENTQAPQFSSGSYSVSIREDYPVDVIISDLSVEILDNDKSSPNNDVSVTVDANCPLLPMEENLSDFQGEFLPVDFKLAKKLDFETQKQYTCTITVTDKGTPPKSATADLTITVNDMPDEPPVFEHEFYYTTLDSPVPDAKQTDLTLEPANINAVDGDQNTTALTFGLGNVIPDVQGTDYFTIDPSNGIVSLVSEIDEEMLKNERLLFFVTATDTSGDASRVVLEITLPPVPTPTPPTTEPSTTLSTTEFTCPPCTTAAIWTSPTTTTTCEPCPTTDTPCPTFPTTAEGATCPPCTTVTMTECPTVTEAQTCAPCPTTILPTTGHGTVCPTVEPSCPPCTTESTVTTTASLTCPPCNTVTPSGTDCPTVDTSCPPCTTVSSGTECPTVEPSCPPCTTVPTGTECPSCPPCSTASPVTKPPDMNLAFKKDSYAGEIYASFTSVFTLTVEVEGISEEDVQFALDDTTYFDISSPSGEITVKSKPPEGTYSLTATASVPREETLTTTTRVNIVVLTQSPSDISTTNSLYRATIDEEDTEERVLVAISTAGDPGLICISNVEPKDYKDHFVAENDGGWKLKKKLNMAIDYEMDSEITFKLQLFTEPTATCTEESPAEILRSEALVIVKVNDVNDNSPVFAYPNKTIEYIAYPSDPALMSVVGPIITLQAMDKDAGTNIKYSLNGSSSGFSIDETSGEIFSENQFSCEEQECQLSVLASDGELASDPRAIMVKSLDMDHIFTLTMSNIVVSNVTSELNKISQQIGATLNKVYVNPVIKSSALRIHKRHDNRHRVPYLSSASRAVDWQVEVNVYATDEEGNLMDLQSLNSGLASAGLDEATAFADRDTFTPVQGETDTTGWKVAVGILAGVLGIALIIAGFLIYKQRKSSAKKDRKISTVGGAYPNLGYTGDKTDGSSTIGKMSNGVNGSLSRTSFSHVENEGKDSPPLYRSSLANTKDSPNAGSRNGTQRGLRRTDPGTSGTFGSSSRAPPPAFKDTEKEDRHSVSSSEAPPSLYPSLATTSAVEDKPYLSSYSKTTKKTPPPLSATPARSILRGGGGPDNHETFPLTDVSLQKSASDKPDDPEADYDKDNDHSTSRFSALKGSPVLRKASSVIDSDHEEADNKSIKSYTSLDAKKSNLKHDKTDADSEEEKKSVAFKVLVDTKTIEAENMGPAQKAVAQAIAQSDALDILEANKKKLEDSTSDGDDEDDDDDDDEGDVRM